MKEVLVQDESGHWVRVNLFSVGLWREENLVVQRMNVQRAREENSRWLEQKVKDATEMVNNASED